MKYLFFLLAGAFFLPATVVAADVVVTNNNEATIRTSISAFASTGGNSGGSVTTGDASAEVRVFTRANDGDVECDVAITETGGASASVEVTTDSTGCSSTSASGPFGSSFFARLRSGPKAR
ncbi:MAG: hypothetical protein Q8R39_01090 [bacterium]|nr:hypothetical protein [bacterium]MDZ4284820.1 hypothetical protein [Patescibacteria group bacterium]